MRTAAWITLLVLASVLLYADTLLLKPGDPRSPTVLHVSPRYVENGPSETGLADPAQAVLADYRAFDLLVLAFLFFTTTLLCLGPLGQESRWKSLLSLSLAVVGTGSCVALGLYCLASGGVFLDYEPLTAYFKPEEARTGGMAVLALGFAVSLAGTVAAFLKSLRDPRGGLP